MRGEHLIQIRIQDKIVKELIRNEAYTKSSAISLSLRKGINFKFLIRKNVIEESEGKYFLNLDVWEKFKNHKLRRGLPFI